MDPQKIDTNPHAFIVQTLAESVHRTRLREAFAQDSQAALSDMKTIGVGYELGSVRAYFSEMSKHRKGLQTKPKSLTPSTGVLAGKQHQPLGRQQPNKIPVKGRQGFQPL